MRHRKPTIVQRAVHAAYKAAGLQLNGRGTDVDHIALTVELLFRRAQKERLLHRALITEKLLHHAAHEAVHLEYVRGPRKEIWEAMGGNGKGGVAAQYAAGNGHVERHPTVKGWQDQDGVAAMAGLKAGCALLDWTLWGGLKLRDASPDQTRAWGLSMVKSHGTGYARGKYAIAVADAAEKRHGATIGAVLSNADLQRLHDSVVSELGINIDDQQPTA